MAVFRKDRGWWVGRFWAAGRLYERAGFPTKRAAREWEWAKKREVGVTGRRGPAPVTVRAAIAAYDLEVVARHATPRAERRAFALMSARWGDRPLGTVDAGDVRTYAAWRVSQPRIRRDRGARQARADPRARPCPLHPGAACQHVAGATVNRELAYLSALWRWAEGRGWVTGANPARAAAVPRFQEPWRPWIVLTPDQEARLWALLPPRVRVQAQLLKHLGVRKGVVLGLDWSQIDWRHRLIQYTSKGRSQVIPLNRTALTLLRSLGPKLAGRVFPGSDTALRRAWSRARLALGLPELRRHDLRVTFARQVHARGADLRTVQALLGHATLEMSRRYIPADLDAQRAAVARLEDHHRSGI